MELTDEYFTVEEVRERVKGEMALMREMSPIAVVTGFCLSTTLSSQAAGLPLVFVISAAGVRP
jgi:hypothetical protein